MKHTSHNIIEATHNGAGADVSAPTAAPRDDFGVGAVPLRRDHSRRGDGRGMPSEYMTTGEAAAYLRRSPSWLVKRPDIPYVRGVPNTYKKSDLDDWFEREKFKPGIN